MIRVGQGIDVHPFDEERPLVLGGIRISERGGLAGHSDADAVLHAITDALLGAVGAGDIGEHFPSEDLRWKGAGSSRFVEEAARLVAEREGSILNLDVTIIAQRPKIAPHRDAIRESIAAILDLPAGRVSVKATTTDHLGFVGRGEGICAMAIVAIEIAPGEASL
jgi:2-C-methyl-D-erythritol 4-phosphate cytidylyltransferase/2-C-methyl-D-erythritol 2,4-cyclodiphosphate synthase